MELRSSIIIVALTRTSPSEILLTEPQPVIFLEEIWQSNNTLDNKKAMDIERLQIIIYSDRMLSVRVLR